MLSDAKPRGAFDQQRGCPICGRVGPTDVEGPTIWWLSCNHHTRPAWGVSSTLSPTSDEIKARQQVSQKAEAWPALQIGRLKDGDRTPEIHHGAIEHGPAWEHETYIPATALQQVREEWEAEPNVLSRQEADLIRTAYLDGDPASLDAIAGVIQRLGDWADATQQPDQGGEEG